MRTNILLIQMISILILALFLHSCSRMSGMPKNVVLEHIDDHPSDSVRIIATERYKSGIIKPIFQGKNYRKAWATPIKVPVLYLDEYENGLKPLEKGGGLQTLSMDLQGSNDVVYTLRSINKNPEAAVPEGAKKWKVEDIVYDAMSAQHPYGAIVVAALADAVQVQHTHPQVFYLPEQSALDSFNQDFRNKLFLLEYEPEGSGNWVNLPGVQKIIDTEDVQDELAENPDARINERALVRARLFDLLIGDWDRHSKQWGWIEQLQADGTKLYTPLPTDRDNAFYNPGGLIPWIITRPKVTPFLRPFKKKIDYVPGMITAFDQFFLLHVPESIFIEEAEYLQADLTDEEIENAFEIWPEQFYKIDAKKMIKKVMARKSKLQEYAIELKAAIDERGPLSKPLKGSSKLYVGHQNVEEPKSSDLTDKH